MAKYVEVLIELEDDVYDGIVDFIGSDNEDDIKRFIVKTLTTVAENEGILDEEGYIDDEY